MKKNFKLLILICFMSVLGIILSVSMTNNDIKSNLLADDRGIGVGVLITPQSAPTNPVPAVVVTEDGTSTTV